jgi:hypothetical protein
MVVHQSDIQPDHGHDGLQHIAHDVVTTGECFKLAWSWCARCRRGYVSGTYRVVSFNGTRQHPQPQTLMLCPYIDCSGSLTRDRWRWASIRAQHSEYPEQPEPGVRYESAV